MMIVLANGRRTFNIIIVGRWKSTLECPRLLAYGFDANGFVNLVTLIHSLLSCVYGVLCVLSPSLPSTNQEFPAREQCATNPSNTHAVVGALYTHALTVSVASPSPLQIALRASM